jgi:hypothetical protein
VKYYLLKPHYDGNGNLLTKWFDAADSKWSCENFWKVSPLKDGWNRPAMTVQGDGPIAEVFFNPETQLVFSAKAKMALGSVVGPTSEWLPISVTGLGEAFFLHPRKSVPLSGKSVFRTNPISGNIVEVTKMCIKNDLQGKGVFLIEQPALSAAHKVGLMFRSIVGSEAVIEAILKSGIGGISYSEVACSE